MKSWRKGMMLAMLSAGVALTVLLPHSSEMRFAKGDLQAQTTVAGVKKHITAVTYNIHIGQDKDDHLNLAATIRTLQETQGDIIGLEEVERHSPRSLFQDQPRLIAEALQMNYHFEPALTVGPFQFGNVLLSRYPILSTERIELKSVKENRVAILATLQVQGEAVRVLVTHLGLVQSERTRDVEHLAQILDAKQGPLLVLGDLNTDIQAPELKPWRERLQMTTTEPVETFPGSGEQIDHVLTSPSFTVDKTYTLPSSASDHVPLISELSWEAGSL